MEFLCRVKEKTKSYIQHVKESNVNWIDRVLRKDCLLKHITEEKRGRGIQATGREGRRCKQPLDDVEEKSGYCKLKEKAPDRTVWRTGFGRSCKPVVRQITE
jgi:hypothetical protein